MSDLALKLYEERRREQITRNEARHIRARVAEARKNPHAASVRWPFELLQNALDAGPRSGRPRVNIRLNCETKKLVFEHDGAPFTSNDLAALLSGGSSKEFESDVTTGRFGTGFLVTHVLAQRTALHALLRVNGDFERFSLVLDRSGDEAAILENIASCDAAIRAATRVTDIESVPSATFEYQLTDKQTLTLGVDALSRAMPYLYATRPNLGSVEIQMSGGPTYHWTVEALDREVLDDGYAERRSLRVTCDDTTLSQSCVWRFTVNEGMSAALLVVAKGEDNWEVRLPDNDSPRIYREYPIRGSAFLPISFILDGKFEPEQERSHLLMGDRDKELLHDALTAATSAVRYATSRRWTNGHLLARVKDPVTAFDASDAVERHWWKTELATFAARLAALPIIEGPARWLPAVADDGPCADFIVPRLLLDTGGAETSVKRMWPLAVAATELDLPSEELALDWTDIAEGWYHLGVQLNRISLANLAESVRGNGRQLKHFLLRGDPTEWLARFLDVVGECWERRAGVDLTVLDGLLPNQHGYLCSPKELQRDDGVTERLKDLCGEMGLDVRGRLLLGELGGLGVTEGFPYLQQVLARTLPTAVSEAEILDEAIDYLGRGLPEDEDCDEDTYGWQVGSIRLASYLWDLHGSDAASLGRRLPFIASTRRSVRWSLDRLMMAPVCTWAEAAQAFWGAYPPHRVLSDMYAGTEDGQLQGCVEALVEWGIALPDPITTDTPSELKGPRLAAIASGSTDGVVVTGHRFSQIALLQPEVLNRCQEGIDEARALVGLVLCHVAPNDPCWREQRVVQGRKTGEVVDVHLQGALWLADLKFRSWVPMVGDDGRMVKLGANSVSLHPLLDQRWLERNDAAIQLLSDWFGFDELELRLLGIAPDAETRQEVRNGLAKLVETVGADPTVYASLAAGLAAQARRRRDVERSRQLGLAVQQAVKVALEQRGLRLTLVDRGFDYEVDLTTDGTLDEIATAFQVGPHLLEVKATTTGTARMTPLQAETAARESTRYHLCVVDLRNSTRKDLDGVWNVSEIEPLTRIVSNVGTMVKNTCVLIDVAKSVQVPIRNEAALRYEVSTSVWESGVSIAQWVASITDR